MNVRAPARRRRPRRPEPACHLVLSVPLAHPAVRQWFRRDYAALSRHLAALESLRRVRGVDADALDARLAHLASALEHLRESVGRASARLQALLDSPIPAPGPGSTSRGTAPAQAVAADARDTPASAPAPFAAVVVSPLATLYLRLLAQADGHFASLDAAWLLGLVDGPRRRQEQARWRRLVHGVVPFAGQCRHEVACQVRAANPPSGAAGAPIAATRPSGETLTSP